MEDELYGDGPVEMTTEDAEYFQLYAPEMECPECGAIVRDGDYCDNCGEVTV